MRSERVKASEVFGENLAKHDIQPVWLSIENETDDQLVYLPIAMDPEYYSPYEVAYRFHGVLSFTANRARDAFFLQRQMSGILPPHSHTRRLCVWRTRCRREIRAYSNCRK